MIRITHSLSLSPSLHLELNIIIIITSSDGEKHRSNYTSILIWFHLFSTMISFARISIRKKREEILPPSYSIRFESKFYTHTLARSRFFPPIHWMAKQQKKKCFNVFAGSFSKRFILSDCILSFHSRFNLTIRKLKPEKIIIAMKIVIVVIILLLSSMLLVSLSHTIPTMMNYFIEFFFALVFL